MPGLPPAIFNCKKSICIMLFVKKKKKKKTLGANILNVFTFDF